MGSLSDDISELTRLAGILRGTESAAQAVAYGINAHKINPWIPIGINVALLLVAVYPTWLVAKDLVFQDENKGVDVATMVGCSFSGSAGITR